MKTRIHRWLLGLMLLLLMPGTLLACLLLVGVIGCGIQQGFRASDFPAMVMLGIPPALIWCGLWLQMGLRQGIHPMLRRKLLAFYLVVLVYCAIWLFSPISHADVEIGFFSTEDQVVGSVVLILPVLITLFTNPEEKREWNPQSGGIRPDRWSDRLVAWLASRIR